MFTKEYLYNLFIKHDSQKSKIMSELGWDLNITYNYECLDLLLQDNNIVCYKRNFKTKIENIKYITEPVKYRLISMGLLKRYCEKCNQGYIFNGKPLNLQLHYLNGKKDKNINNILIVCPNCQSQTNTFCIGKNSRRKLYDIDKECLEKIIKEKKTITSIGKELGFTMKTPFDYRCAEYILQKNNIEIKKKKSGTKQKYDLSKYKSNNSLKERLLIDNILKNECSMCLSGFIHNNLPMNLQLDHIDGNNKNNTLSNLRILCYNCHTQTITFAKPKKNINIVNKVPDTEKNLDIDIIIESTKYCIRCNYKLCDSKRKTNMCSRCSSLTQRKVERPSMDVLIDNIKNMGYKNTGKMYGVSDNAIRKWIKFYEDEKKLGTQSETITNLK